jgi:hypothetical protein
MADLDDRTVSECRLRLPAKLVQLGREFLMDAVEEVPVYAQGHGGVGVSDPLRNRQDVRSSIDEQAGVRMPEVLGAKGVGKSCGPQGWPDHRLTELVPLQRTAVRPDKQVLVSAGRAAAGGGPLGEHLRHLPVSHSGIGIRWSPASVLVGPVTSRYGWSPKAWIGWRVSCTCTT